MNDENTIQTNELSVFTVILQFNVDDNTSMNFQKRIVNVMDNLDKEDISVLHLETRKLDLMDAHESNLVCLITLKSSKTQIQLICQSIGQMSCVKELKWLENSDQKPDIWLPKHISDLDFCRHLLTKFEPGLRTDHPGFHDKDYIRRRSEIAELAFNYKHGNPIQKVDYTDHELRTWKEVYTTLRKAHPLRACKEYIQGFEILERSNLFSPDEIPQLQNVSQFLHKTSGFRLRPVAGLVSPRDFLASLAFRIFQCTQYIRHHSRPFHTPEPDLIHEMLGHMPLLTNRVFADFSQKLGLASLGASDEEINKLATLYWFTVEFGLCRENGEMRALGAGLLSSYGELENAFSDKSEKRSLDVDKTSIQPYDDVGYQAVYYVADDFESLKKCLSGFFAGRPKKFEAVYDSFTETMSFKTHEQMKTKLLNEIENNINYLRDMSQVLS